MLENFANLPRAVTLVLGMLIIAWLVLLLLVPFMIESIRASTRRSYLELEKLNDRLERLAALVERRSEPPAVEPQPSIERRPITRPASEARPERRKEPTISG